jgi:hypothetical protein
MTTSSNIVSSTLERVTDSGQQQQADHRRSPTTEDAIRGPTGQVGAGSGAHGDHKEFYTGLADRRLLHVHQVRHTPVQKAVATGIQQAQRQSQQPQRRIEQCPEEIFGQRRAVSPPLRIRLGRRSRRAVLGGSFSKKQQHHQARRRQQRGRHVQGAAPTQHFRRSPGNQVRQTQRDLIAGADDSDRLAAPQNRNPVADHADAGGPAQRLEVTIAGPDEQQKIKAGGHAEQSVQSGRAEHADGQQHARRNPLGQLPVHELAQAIGDLQRSQDPSDFLAAEPQSSVGHGAFQSWYGRRNIGPAKVERAVGQPDRPDDSRLAGPSGSARRLPVAVVDKIVGVAAHRR